LLGLDWISLNRTENELADMRRENVERVKIGGISTDGKRLCWRRMDRAAMHGDKAVNTRRKRGNSGSAFIRSVHQEVTGHERTKL
jgi:hypothetical protein